MEVFVKGIDFSLPGNGGPECAKYLSAPRQVIEFLAGVTVSLSSLGIGISMHTKPKKNDLIGADINCKNINVITKGLFLALIIVYVAEITYKIVTSQAVFIVNPCHMLCLIQMLILYQFNKALTNRQSSTACLTYAFRLHLYILHGPLMAVIFPVTNTLFLPGEVLVYWLEHALLLGIPIFLLFWGKISVPDITIKENLAWGLMAYGLWGLFHFLFLQPIATLTLANLNSILCPAISDPFRGPNYRSYAIIHQFFTTLICGCVVNLFGRRETLDKFC